MHPLMKNSKQNGILNFVRILLSIFIIFSTFNPIMLASAASDSTISISSKTVNPGENADVVISIANCENVTGLNFTLKYDSNILSLTNISENKTVVSEHVVSYTNETAGEVKIDLIHLDNLTREENVPLINISFKALSSGNSSLELQVIKIISTNNSLAPDKIEDGYIAINEVQNVAPTASIVSISHESAVEGTTVTFNGSGTDSDGTIVEYNWTSDIDGKLNDSANFSTSSLSLGTHTINFSVQDNDSSWSDIESDTITITEKLNVSPTASIDSISPNPAEEGEKVTFKGSGTDSDGTITGYNWTSDIDGKLNDSADFSTSDLSLGTHAISFSVQDNDGEWSDIDSATITISEISDSPASPGSSSGGGGGSVGTGEKYENIVSKDYVLKSVLKDTETVFAFHGKNNSIVSVSITSIINSGQVKSVVEILKDTSSQVNSRAPGQVYNNVNILLDDKKLNAATINNAKVEFKVEKKWLDDNEIDVSTITLCRYYGSTWEPLATEIKDEDDSYFYFISTTSGFSPFAISSIKPMTAGAYIAEDIALSSTGDEHTVMSTSTPGSDPIKPSTEATQKGRSVLPSILVVGLVAIMILGVFGYRNRDYYDKLRKQIGNPDGKRYRRIK